MTGIIKAFVVITQGVILNFLETDILINEESKFSTSSVHRSSGPTSSGHIYLDAFLYLILRSLALTSALNCINRMA